MRTQTIKSVNSGHWRHRLSVSHSELSYYFSLIAPFLNANTMIVMIAASSIAAISPPTRPNTQFPQVAPSKIHYGLLVPILL